MGVVFKMKLFNNIRKKLAYPWRFTGAFFAFNKKYEKAINYYDKALKIYPEYYELLSNKGNCLSQLKRYNEALNCENKALKINPNYALAWNGKALALGRLGKYQESIECYEKYIEIAPPQQLNLINQAKDIVEQLKTLEELLR